MPNIIGKLIIIIGVSITLIGLIIYFKDSIPLLKQLGKLPGDITIKKENFIFYFPLGTSILVSILLSIILIIFKKLK